MPPTDWTIGFGSPVVPEEYSTQSGAANGTGVNTGSAASAVSASQPTAPAGTGVPSTGMCTQAASPGSASRSRDTVAVTSKSLPP